MGSECVACGYLNPLGAKYCMSCGAKQGSDVEPPTEILEATADAPAVQVPTGGVPVGMLVVRQGPKRGSRIALDAELVTLGRHPDSDVFLDDITVSRRHAEIRRTDSGYEVADAGSLNGTYVNKALVERADLEDGDEVQVGKFKLVFLALEGDE